MPIEAVIIAIVRLKIQSTFVAIDSLDFLKDEGSKSGMVELMKFPLMDRCEICTESCMRI